MSEQQIQPLQTITLQMTREHFTQPDPERPDMWVLEVKLGFSRIPDAPVAVVLLPPAPSIDDITASPTPSPEMN